MEYINPSNKSSIKKKKKKNLVQKRTFFKQTPKVKVFSSQFPSLSIFQSTRTSFFPIPYQFPSSWIPNVYRWVSLSYSLSSDTAYHQVREGWTRSNKRGIQGDKQLARLFDGQTPINHSEVAERGVGEEGGCQAKSK